MDTSTAQKMDSNAILDRVVPVSQMIMFGAMKADGMQFSSSIRESGAAAKYLVNSKNTHSDNPIIQGVAESLSHRKGQYTEKVDLRTLSDDEVMKKVDEIEPILDEAGEQGTQTKTFLFGLAETIVGASGSGFMGGGERITEGEAKFLDDLKAHLRILETEDRAKAQEQLQVQQAQQLQASPVPQQASLAASSSVGGPDVTSQLQKLAELHQQGIISDEEFAAAKKRVLG